jgi:hypothetical protein
MIRLVNEDKDPRESEKPKTLKGKQSDNQGD